MLCELSQLFIEDIFNK